MKFVSICLVLLLMMSFVLVNCQTEKNEQTFKDFDDIGDVTNDDLIDLDTAENRRGYGGRRYGGGGFRHHNYGRFHGGGGGYRGRGYYRRGGFYRSVGYHIDPIFYGIDYRDNYYDALG